VDSYSGCPLLGNFEIEKTPHLYHVIIHLIDVVESPVWSR
jgi:hypothetical protein